MPTSNKLVFFFFAQSFGYPKANFGPVPRYITHPMLTTKHLFKAGGQQDQGWDSKPGQPSLKFSWNTDDNDDNDNNNHNIIKE